MSYKKWVYKYKYLKTEENEFAEKMQKYTIIVHPESKNLIKELNNYIWLDKKRQLRMLKLVPIVGRFQNVALLPCGNDLCLPKSVT